jgi:phage gpG-like protein
MARLFAKETLVLAAIAVTAQPVAHAATTPRAQTARTLSVRDEGKLRFLSSSGSSLLDEGTVTGTIPGRARVSFTYDGSPNVTARFTIYGRGGSISGVAKGRLNSPNSLTPSFRGSLAITGGHGRYAHAHGNGELYGVFYRRGYALTVQALGRLRY